MRLREVVYHHFDLAAGYSFEDVDGELLARFISDAVRRLSMSRHAPDLRLSTAEGDQWTLGEGSVTVTGSRAGMLLWLARRRADPTARVRGATARRRAAGARAPSLAPQ